MNLPGVYTLDNNWGFVIGRDMSLLKKSKLRG